MCVMLEGSIYEGNSGVGIDGLWTCPPDRQAHATHSV